MLRPILCATLSGLAGVAAAEAPKVAVDIAPVHSLVARVMEGVGEPSLVIPANASPHDHAMRPSEARALQEADVVFWIGEDLTPWMTKPLGSLAPDAQQISLLEIEGVNLHDYRDLDGDHEDEEHDDHDDHADDHDDHDDHADDHDDHDDHADDHDDHDDHADHDDHDGHDHDGHDDHDHDDHGDKGHDDHADDHADHDDHAGHDDHDAEEQAQHDDHGHHHHHDGVDPHAWLDPQNARVWVAHIAAVLSEADPENAGTYQQNASAADADLQALEDQIAKEISGMQAQRFITFHDAYQYFEDRFGLKTSGTVSLGDASAPGPARLAALRDRIAEEGIDCAFSEPQFDTRLIEVAIEGSNAHVYELDPIGVGLEPGPDLYPALLRKMTEGYGLCIAGS